ncbi:MAG: chromosome partitioning protein [Acidobacteriota bacterium]|nr:chromosome partitioning protein [Acidobacteriota bacterium]
MEAIISVTNVARGVGKTATAVHLAAEWALRGFETLLVDADPQAEATALLVGEECGRLSVADALRAYEPIEHGRDDGAPLVGLSDVLAPTELARLWLAPSSIALAATEGDDSPCIAGALHTQLAALSARFDFAVIDTPPSLGPLAAACLSASTHLLVPVAPRTQGVAGLRCLSDAFGDMPCAAEGERAELLGVVCNLFDPRERSAGEFYEGIKRLWGGGVFETIIHRDAFVEGCAGWPVQLYAPSSVASGLYAELADEVLARLSDASAVAGAHAA